MSDAQIVYRSGVKFFGGRSKMPAWAEDRLRGYMDDAGVPVLQISSGYRTPEDQARIMYDNIQAHGLASQRALYGATPNRVLDVYESNSGSPRADVIAAMADKIREIGPEKISRHMAEDAITFDISPSSMPSDQATSLLSRMRQVPNNPSWRSSSSVPEIGELYWPPKDPAYHVEFPIASAPADAETDTESGGLGIADVVIGGAAVAGVVLAARKIMKRRG